MKKTLLTLIALLCASSIAVMAQDKAPDKKAEGKKAPMTAEQKAKLKEITDKYDTNKDGKLDKEESAKVSAEDKAAMRKIRGIGEGKKTQGDKKKETK